MGRSESGRVQPLILALLALVVAAVVAVATAPRAPVEAAGAGMAISLYRDTAKTPQTLVCGPGAAGRDCGNVPVGVPFSIDIGTNSIPANGYTAYQVAVQYSTALTLIQQPGRTENRWPDSDCSSGVESKSTGMYTLRCETLTASFYQGVLANVHFTCPTQGGQMQIDLIAGTGTGVSYYFKPSVGGNFIYLKSQPKGTKTIADSIHFNCDPDSDSDGCSNTRELQPKAMASSGGGRDPFFFWDFFDTPDPSANPMRDRTIDLQDVQRVAARFATNGNPNGDPLSTPPPTGYHTAYDRGPQIGPNPWNIGPANGSIGLTDVFAVAHQFAHNCA